MAVQSVHSMRPNCLSPPNRRHKKTHRLLHLWVILLGAWRCATLTWGSPTLPSPLIRFTSEFEMDSGGAASLWSPSKNWLSITNLEKTVKVFVMTHHHFYILYQNATHHKHDEHYCLTQHLNTLKRLRRCMVKPHGQLVQVSLTPCNASTPCLSTSSSTTTL